MTAPRSRRNKGAKRRPATLGEVTEQGRAQMASRLHNRGELAKARIVWALTHPERAAEVGVILGDRTLKQYDVEIVEVVPGEDRTTRYDLEVVNGVPHYIQRDDQQTRLSS